MPLPMPWLTRVWAGILEGLVSREHLSADPLVRRPAYPFAAVGLGGRDQLFPFGQDDEHVHGPGDRLQHRPTYALQDVVPAGQLHHLFHQPEEERQHLLIGSQLQVQLPGVRAHPRRHDGAPGRFLLRDLDGDPQPHRLINVAQQQQVTLFQHHLGSPLGAQEEPLLAAQHQRAVGAAPVGKDKPPPAVMDYRVARGDMSRVHDEVIFIPAADVHSARGEGVDPPWVFGIFTDQGEH